jgi:hypothetical protein
MEDFENLKKQALADYPIYRAIVEGKIMGY